MEAGQFVCRIEEPMVIPWSIGRYKHEQKCWVIIDNLEQIICSIKSEMACKLLFC
jgi:hypothetical protein